MSPPTADFACLSVKCKTEDGAAPTYELPITAIRCPVCGSKRVKRLFNKIAVLRGAAPDRDPRLTSSSHLVRSTALLTPGFDHADSVKPPKDMTSFALESSQFGGFQPGKSKPLTQMEIMRERRHDPHGAVAALAAQAGFRIPTVATRDEKTG